MGRNELGPRAVIVIIIIIIIITTVTLAHEVIVILIMEAACLGEDTVTLTVDNIDLCRK